MTPERYVQEVQNLAERREYGPLLIFAERYGPDIEEQLTAEQLRILRVHMKHADMVMAEVRLRVNSA